MNRILQHQPFKGLYLAYFACSLVFVKVPIWAIYYLPRSKRPRRAWSLKRSLIVRTSQELFTLRVSIERKPDPRVEVPDSALKDAKFVWVDGIPDDLFCGEIRRMAQITGVQPTRIPGYWLLKAGSPWTGERAKPGEKTVLHLHGGGLHIGSANPSDITSNLTRGLLHFSRSLERTFAVDYRLAASAPNPPANPFPAALLDAIAAYRGLVQDAGFEPRNVIVAGDSAGANIAIGLVRHLVENPTTFLPPPGGILVASAWLDLSMSRNGPQSTAALNAPSDIFAVKPRKPVGTYGVTSVLGPLPAEEVKNRYLSTVSAHVQPADRLFEGFPETYVVAGGAERLLDDSTALIEMMEKDGVKVISDIYPDAVHDFVIFTWHEPERTEALAIESCRAMVGCLVNGVSQ